MELFSLELGVWEISWEFENFCDYFVYVWCVEKLVFADGIKFRYGENYYLLFVLGS